MRYNPDRLTEAERIGYATELRDLKRKTAESLHSEPLRTKSFGIRNWAALGGHKLEHLFSIGEGDHEIIAWKRSDGEVALETNGEPVFGPEAEQWIAEQTGDVWEQGGES